MHRYAAIDKREAIAPAFQLLLDIVDDVLAIEKADVIRAGEIVQNRASLSARDSLHIAVMERHRIPGQVIWLRRTNAVFLAERGVRVSVLPIFRACGRTHSTCAAPSMAMLLERPLLVI